MSLRPRFAGDGRLRLPAAVVLPRTGIPEGEIGLVRAELGDDTCDPFERDEDGLLLAESFARLEVGDKRRAREWFVGHGILGLEAAFPGEFGQAPLPGYEDYVDNLAAVLGQRDNVRWHLETLALLSADRHQAGPPAPDRVPHAGWDGRRAQPALVARNEILWLGASNDYEGHIRGGMASFSTWHEAPAEDRPSLGGRAAASEVRDVWWPQAHGAWQRVRAEGVPLIWVSHADWVETWSDWHVDASAPAGRLPSGPLHVDWHGLLDLQRLLIAPYVRRAAANEVVIDRKGLDDPGGEGPAPGPVRVREWRLWRSLLAPVYLQLFEGLRRVSEGHSGAAWCRECGQPFLTLDARRSSFCNDRERYRYSQRDSRRRRQAATGPGHRVPGARAR